MRKAIDVIILLLSLPVLYLYRFMTDASKRELAEKVVKKCMDVE